MLAALSALVAIACVLASARRLASIVAPTQLDHALLADALRREGKPLLGSLARESPPGWERELFEAFGEKNASLREALVGERMTDLDAHVGRWARVPRVCASLAARAGFLFGALALLGGATSGATLRESLPAGLDALCVGIAGTAFCVAVIVRGRAAARIRAEGTGRLLKRLEALSQVEAQPYRGG